MDPNDVIQGPIYEYTFVYTYKVEGKALFRKGRHEIKDGDLDGLAEIAETHVWDGCMCPSDMELTDWDVTCARRVA